MPDNPLIVPNSVTASFADVVMSLGDIAFDTAAKVIRLGDGVTAGGLIFPEASGIGQIIASAILHKVDEGDPISILAETDTAKILTAFERGKIAIFDNTSTRFFLGKPIVQAALDPTQAAGWFLTSDGYLYSKPAIRIGANANGLTWTKAGDGFYEIGLGAAAGVLPLGSAGDMIDTRSIVYMGGQQVRFAVSDTLGRTPLAITADGFVRGKFAIALGVSNGLTRTYRQDGTTTFSLGTVEGQLPLGSGGDAIDTRSNAFVRGKRLFRGVVDAAGLLALGVLADGTVYIPKLLSDSAASLEQAVDGPGYLFDTMRVGTKRQIFRTSKATGVRTQATTTGNNDNVRLSDDKSAVLYTSDRSGSSVEYYQPLAGGPERSVFSRKGFVGAGDSLTFGTGSTTPATDAIVAQVAIHYGAPFTNLGRPGATAAEVAGFIGAVDPLATFANNQIVTGSQAITLDIPFLSANGGTGNDSQKRTIAGISGTVAKSGGTAPDYTGSYTFTPDSAQGLPLNLSGPVPVTLAANTNSEKIALIRVGRNNTNGAAFDQAWSDDAFLRTQQIVAWLKPLVKNFIILPVPNGNYSTEASGGATGASPGAGYLALMAHNARLAAAYPNNYLDDRALIVAAYNPNIAQDVTDHANDVPPSSLRADNIHWTTAGYAISAAAIWAFIDARGWYTNPALAPYA